MKTHNIHLPAKMVFKENLSLGDTIFLSGLLITARDQAHKRIIEYSQEARKLPKEFNQIKNCAIYHCGPIVKEINGNYQIISGGPTTSSRMDSIENIAMKLLDIHIVIGKGGMKNLDTKNGNNIYLSYTGGCGALVNKKVRKITNVVWKDLGLCEAIWFLEVDKFGPLIVSQLNGKSLYSEE